MPDRIYHRLSNSRQLIVKGEQLFLQEEESPQCFKGGGVLLVIIPTLLIVYVFFSYIYCFLFTGSNCIPHSRGNIILKFSIYLELDILQNKYQGIKFHHFRFHKESSSHSKLQDIQYMHDTLFLHRVTIPIEFIWT